MALNNLKQTPIPVVPRTLQIVNADGTPTRSGQLLLQQLSANVLGYGAAGGADTSMPDGSLYVVQGNNSEVLYQLQGGEWHYVAGTMWATLNPDQRPTGLGPDDAGFTFRTIDSDPQYSGRTFVWSGSEWVETTAARFNTHAARLAAPVYATMNGTIWVETDRSEVIYQLQGSSWHFLAGTMWGTLSPDQRPTDLGANDAGFSFRGTDQQKQYIWSGTVWVDVTPQANSVQFAQASATVTLTATAQLIPGAVLTLARAGTYLINAVFDFLVAAGTPTSTTYCLGNLSAPGLSASQDAIFAGLTNASVNARATVFQQYVYQTALTGQVVQLQASLSGTASASVQNNHTTITALWVSP